jgi:cytochrome c-type biogenesis protein CcmH
VTWILAIGLALAAFAGLAFVLGIAGYGIQASPGIEGAPKAPAQQFAADPGALVKARGVVSESDLPPSNKWVVIADGLARNGQYANAAQVLLGALDEDPENGEAWLALANALVSHADGLLTPASQYAFAKAAEAEPEHPGPPFFFGLALAQSGRFAEARSLWSELLERSPEDARWRGILEAQLRTLDSIIAQRQRL